MSFQALIFIDVVAIEAGGTPAAAENLLAAAVDPRLGMALDVLAGPRVDLE